MAVAGKDYVIIASDSRLSESYMIHSRNCSKLHKLTSKAYLACAGFHGDVCTLISIIDTKLKMYEHEHHEEMSLSALAQMISTILYYQRFLPYYVYNILAGIDRDGTGKVFHFDVLGSYESLMYDSAGSAGSILQPLLDNLVGKKNQFQSDSKTKDGKIPTPYADPSEILANHFVKEFFSSAAERDIYTGDNVDMAIIKANALTVTDHFKLRKD
jgi:20S proteasome subunit beta 6